MKNVDNNEVLIQETVSGRVIDLQTSEALPGVNIILEGTTTGTTTNIDGEFELNVPSLNETLVFSYIGYQSLEIPIDGRLEINVELIPQAVAGDELVVVGYGEQRRRDLTVGIGSVTPANIEDLPISSMDQALQGQIAGVRAQVATGTPGGGVNLQIRGVGSITAAGQPLYVIDGVPIDQQYSQDTNPLAMLDTEDIETIDILKDASATAIYGSRGSAGVVLITTKRGRTERPRIEISSYMGWQEPQNLIEMMDPVDLIEMFVEARNNSYMRAARIAGVEASPDDPNIDRNIIRRRLC